MPTGASTQAGRGSVPGTGRTWWAARGLRSPRPHSSGCRGAVGSGRAAARGPACQQMTGSSCCCAACISCSPHPSTQRDRWRRHPPRGPRPAPKPVARRLLAAHRISACGLDPPAQVHAGGQARWSHSTPPAGPREPLLLTHEEGLSPEQAHGTTEPPIRGRLRSSPRTLRRRLSRPLVRLFSAIARTPSCSTRHRAAARISLAGDPTLPGATRPQAFRTLRRGLALRVQRTHGSTVRAREHSNSTGSSTTGLASATACPAHPPLHPYATHA